MTETLLHLIQQGWGKPGSAFMKSFSTLFMPDATSDQVDSFIGMQLASAAAGHAVALRRAIGGFDVSADLGRIRAPTLVVHARHDAVQPFEEGQRLARSIPDARFVAYDSANHILMPQEPAWAPVMDAMDRFLAETGN